jgi:hypothetical protein
MCLSWRTLLRMLAVSFCVATLVAASGWGQARAGSPQASAGSAMPKLKMVGNMDPYPNLKRAGHRNVRRARRLQRQSRRSADRFDTLAKAQARGYRTRRMRRPGFVHARKFDTRFWGRVFDPAAPQALMYWCPARGRCTLTTYMYRAPAGPPPPTWRRLLQWHRHGDRTTTWMTHVWLVAHTRAAFATCAPWAALHEVHGLNAPSRYRHHMIDEPCPEDDSMPMHDH